MKKFLLLATVALALIATSCNSLNNEIDINGEWKVSTINGEAVPQTMEAASLTFDKNTNSYNGVTGVNLINGSYQQKDNDLTISDGAMTRKLGDPVSNDVETKYINAIHATASAAIEDGKLILKDSKGNTLMELVK